MTTSVWQRAHTVFLMLWLVTAAVKLWIASQLPLFVDEAFYWQEGQHLAMAYSDLPGMTAWLARLGVELGGNHVLALRLPFLLIGAMIPWFVVRITARWFGEEAGWKAGSLSVLMPLSGTMGILAIPDVPMTLAAMLCLHAGARLLRQINAFNAAELAIGLAIGALSHYRFLGVIGMGFIALLLLPAGRRLFLDSRIWLALSIGMVSWLPLLAWNMDNHDAGLRFQLLERHPWNFQLDGLKFLLIQPLATTPLLFVAMMIGVWRAWRGTDADWPARYVATMGGVTVGMIFLMGFFTDVERVSFHWPLSGLLALLALVPGVIAGWRPVWRYLLWSSVVAGFTLAMAYFVMASTPAFRTTLADTKVYPRNFIGWESLATAVRQELAQMPADTRIIAGSFKGGAELGFQLGNAEIAVLPHALNDRHGRTAQLARWGLLVDGPEAVPRLLVINPADQKFRDLLDRYHLICGWLGALPPPRTVSIDHGRQRFLLFRLPAGRIEGECVTPAMAWVDTPAVGQSVNDVLEVRGWAFKDGVGLARVELLLDDQPVGDAVHGEIYDVRETWPASTDPDHPRVGFSARLDVSSLSPGQHWLGLRLHGRDGSQEDWGQQHFEKQR